jgi:signal transduction histidine kinase
MKIKNRIFLSNTLMVFASLILFLGINGALISLFQKDYLSEEIEKAKLDENVYEVQTLFEQPYEELLDFNTLNETLSTYDYKLCVLKDEEIVFSNLKKDGKDPKISILATDLSGEHARVFSWQFLTAVGKSFVIEDHEYRVVAFNTTDRRAWIDGSQEKFKAFLIDFILVGCATIIILLGVSQLFTNRLVKRLMKPVNNLIAASKRIEEGNLKEPIIYTGYDEFETVCASFNQMQHHLLEEQQQIASYEKARTDMVSGISHDLRTPLTSVKGYIKGLKDGVANTPEKQMQYLDIAYGKACEMDVLLQRLFYFSKMETGNMPFYKTVVNFNEFVNNFVEGCRQDLATKGVIISSDSSANNPMVSIDMEQMQRVFTNLTENSIKYGDKKELEIEILLTQEKNWLVIVVSDNGNGVENDKLPHLFEQFYRGDESRSSKNGEGNGLGLYIAKYIVEAHDGTIMAENDNGLKVTIKIPLERMAQDE